MTHEGQPINEEAVRRHEESDDPRVISNPENFNPADVPPQPLTPIDSSSNTGQEPTENDDKTDVQARPEPKEEDQTHGESSEESDAS
jgi:hypothetical protein